MYSVDTSQIIDQIRHYLDEYSDSKQKSQAARVLCVMIKAQFLEPDSDYENKSKKWIDIVQSNEMIRSIVEPQNKVVFG